MYNLKHVNVVPISALESAINQPLMNATLSNTSNDTTKNINQQ
jgi:hypothetical protein